ncbi:MAG TPA: PP2C family protein-serine/threonine phosphatase [Bryobacteraceae bacterium]
MAGRDLWTNQRWRLERILALLFIFWAILTLTGTPAWIKDWFTLGLIFLGSFVAYRFVRRGVRRIIWRLRNRLIVTYVFIAVVPVLLIVVLVGLGSYIIFGQVADYLIATELARRADSLSASADALSQASPEFLERRVDETAKRTERRFPQIEILVTRGARQFRYPDNSTLTAPPNGWGDYAGLVERDRRHYEMAHVKRSGVEVTLLAPIGSDLLSTMVPGMADVQFIGLSAAEEAKGQKAASGKDAVRIEKPNPDPKIRTQEHLPPAATRLDFEVYWLATPRVPMWSQPNRERNGFLSITTRPSAVVEVLFGAGFATEQWSLFALLMVAGVFVLVEIGALIIGISLARTITGAVHGLYEGTEHVTSGDFSHRVTVQGNDQLGELGNSFNSMTENLSRLIVVAKEKERLESEIEIARGVQNQLFPKAAPTMKTLQLSGSCRPARMVSGDYYDFLCLPNGNVAIAIGDVAGKGIAAALLMASIQSIMRTQLTAGLQTGRNGNGHGRGGTVSRMVGELNRQLYANTSPEKYATFCFGLYDEEQMTFTYTNAGHLPPILLHDGQPQLLEVTGTVVGAFPLMQYEERTVSMGPGDILVAYTDGIVEPENVYGEEFGADRMMEMVVKYQSETSDEIITRIMEAVPNWTGSQELFDDMTVVLARRCE